MDRILCTFELCITFCIFFAPQIKLSGHIPDLCCIRLSNAAPFDENYTKLYFDAKHSERGLNRGWGMTFLMPSFLKKSALSGQYRTLPYFSRICPDLPSLQVNLLLQEFFQEKAKSIKVH